MRYQGRNMRWAFTLFLALMLAIAIAGVAVGLARGDATSVVVGLVWGALTVPPFAWLRQRYVTPAVTFTGDRVDVEGVWAGPYSFTAQDIVRVRRYVNRGGVQYRVLLRGEDKPRTVPVGVVDPEVETELLGRIDPAALETSPGGV